MDASHTCDNPEDTDNSLSTPEPPDPPSNDASMDRFNDHMNNPETQEKLKKWIEKSKAEEMELENQLSQK